MKSLINKLFLYVIIIHFFSFNTSAQKVFSVDYRSQADVKVFVVKYENQADLNVFKVDYSNQASENNGNWLA